MTIEQIQDHAHRYLTARFGADYVYRAPETFTNVIDRWIWAVGADSSAIAEKCITAIEEHLTGGAS